jgi:hypothetical protein
MERGPMALFGAIIAVGLGPALWLGAQFGSVGSTPVSPPAVVSEQNAEKAPGGAGAAPDEEPIAEPTKPTRYKPLSGTPTARPSATAKTDKPEPAKSSEPVAEPSPSDDPTTPPTESTTSPATEPGDDGTEPPTTDPGTPAEPVGDQIEG